MTQEKDGAQDSGRESVLSWTPQPEFYHDAPARWQYLPGSARYRDLTQRELRDLLQLDDLPVPPTPIRPGLYRLDRIVSAPTLAERCALTVRDAAIIFVLFMGLFWLLLGAGS